MEIRSLWRTTKLSLWCLACVVVVAPAATVPVQAQPYRALPVDLAGQVPAVETLRDALLDAVRRRDTDAVVALASPNIALSFGGHSGRETLRQWLDGDDEMPWTGEVYWRELLEALELGGSWWRYDAQSPRSFCAPYTFYADFPDEWDQFTLVMIIRDDAPLRAGPGEEHPVIAELSYDIAEITSEWEPRDDPYAPYWLRVRTADGAHEGYVVSTDFRSPIDYRACFGQDPDTGEWVWDAFIAGD